MNHADFDREMDRSIIRSRAVLERKATEYSSDDDRLENFYCAAGAQGIEPTQALVGMMTKHFVSVAKMAKCPGMYNLETWQEKLVDLRNYTILLDALLIDLGVGQ